MATYVIGAPAAIELVAQGFTDPGADAVAAISGGNFDLQALKRLL